MRYWYVAKTKPRQEKQTAVVFQQRGVETVLPQLAVWKANRTGGSVKRLEPLFPGYLFAKFELHSPEWLAVRSAPGVSYFLGRDKPVPLPEELVEEISVRAATQLRQGWPSRLRRGDRVVITAGPLAGLDAVFDGRLTRSGRSQVLISIVNRFVPVSVPAHFLRIAG